MKEDIYCQYCSQRLGRVHGYQVRILVTTHFRNEHPKEKAEMQEMYEKLKKLRKLYDTRVVQY